MNILAIDDHELFRKGMKYLLSGIDDTICYTEASSIAEAINEHLRSDPELILLDYFMPDIDGKTALIKVREAFESSTIVVLSSLDDPALIRGAIEHGAAGFIPKASNQTTLINALKLILDGGTYLPRISISTLRAQNHSDNELDSDTCGTDILKDLTKRQREVIRGVVSGKSNKVIAYEMNVSEGTVKSHLSAAFRHLGVSSRTQAVILLANHDVFIKQIT